MNLPAGLLPGDMNIEIFANPTQFGKCLFLQHGQTKPFHELPTIVLNKLYRECFDDKKAVKAMGVMGVEINYMVEQYNYCNRGRLDSTPDITPSGKLTKEFVDCGRHGNCPGENIVCPHLVIEGSRITHRERECLSHLVKPLKDQQIQAKMGFRSINAVNSLMQRLRDKTGCPDRTALALTAKEAGLS
jgi:DNA-binding CsgD family transcriptional regulator